MDPPERSLVLPADEGLPVHRRLHYAVGGILSADGGHGGGWQAELDLTFAPIGGRTALARRQHRGPLRVLRPFYPEGEVCHVYVVHPPGGVVGGDGLDIGIASQPGSQALITTPAAGKFYRSEGLVARQSVNLQVCANASLEWLPQETIYYPGARVRQRTVVRLAQGDHARFIGWEVGCFGLAASGQAFDHGMVAQGFEVWRGDRPLLLDHLRIDGSGPMMHAKWGLAGHTVLGTLVACPATREDVEALRASEAAADPGIGVTLIDGVLVVRCVGAHADAVLRHFVALWQRLRPQMMQRPAVLPRIWAT